MTGTEDPIAPHRSLVGYSHWHPGLSRWPRRIESPMPKLRKLLGSCFGYAAVISSAMFTSLAPVLFRSPLPHVTSRFHAEPVQLLLIAMRELLLVMPAIVGVASGMAWWAIRKNAPSARPWAIAASISSLVQSAPFFLADVAIVQYSVTGVVGFTGVLVLSLALLSLGIAGIVAFGKHNAPGVAHAGLPLVTADVEHL